MAAGEEDDLPLLNLCVSRSWWSGARAVVSRAHRRTSAGAGKALQDEVTGLMAGVKHHADELAAYADAAYRGQTKGLSDVPCALQWAQNSTTVFLAVKYAARWSAPGALEIVDVTVNISDHRLDLEGFGHHSGIRKRYLVDLGLFANVTPAESSWSASSVGRLTALLHKDKPGEKWKRLAKEKGKLKHQLTTWMDMEERYSGELEMNTGNVKPRPTPAPSPPAESPAKGKAEKASKRTGPAWWKSLKKTWRRLKKSVGGPKSAAGVLGVGFLIGILTTLLARSMLRLGGSRSQNDSFAKKAATAAEARAFSSHADDQQGGADGLLADSLDTTQGHAREEELDPSFEADQAPDSQAES